MLKLGYERSTLLRELESGLSLWLIGRDRLLEFSRAVFAIYSETYGARHGWSGPLNEFGQLIMEDTDYRHHSAFFAVCAEDGQIVSTGRITRKDASIQLPIETFFGIDLDSFAAERGAGNIYHAGRLTSNAQLLEQQGFDNPRRVSMRLLRSLHEISVGLIAPEEDSIFVGELDEMALRFYRRMLNLPVECLGPAQLFLGSPTLPVMIATAAVPDQWIEGASQIQAAMELAS